jgi:hypothetical protein
MLFSIFCKSFIIFEHVIYPHKKYEAGFLLLADCLVVEGTDSACRRSVLFVICEYLYEYVF